MTLVEQNMEGDGRLESVVALLYISHELSKLGILSLQAPVAPGLGGLDGLLVSAVAKS